MARFDTAIVNGTAVLPRYGLRPATIAIDGGKIAAVLDPGDRVDAGELIDATGKHVFPGLIEPHMHVGFLGLPMDDVASETRSASIGGVTTVLNYLVFPDKLEEHHAEFLDYIGRLAYVDMGLHIGIFNGEQLRSIPRFISELGVTSFKHFMSWRGEEASKRGFPPTDDGLLVDTMREVARHPGAVLNVHAEDQGVIAYYEQVVRAEGLDGPVAHDRSRPSFAEAADVLRAGYFSDLTRCPIYFVHLSSKEAATAVRAYKAGGRVFVETTPQYLSLTVERPPNLLAKINPPVRHEEDIDALWSAVADGVVDTIGCDHAARLRSEKQGGVWKAGSAFPGVATMLSVLLNEGHHKRGVSLARIAELTSYNTARIFGLYPRKGTLEPGSDADVAIVDVQQERTVDAAYCRSRADFTPWEGWTLKGWTVRTLVRGRTVMQDGEIVGTPGYGTYLRRSLQPEVAAAR
jgi:dihydropyrimidinase